MPKKLKTLVFVEGEAEELPLFERFARVEKLNLDIYPVSCNIYSFYRKLVKGGMMQDVPNLARQIVAQNPNAPRKIRKGAKFQAIYYVYDCDLQHTLHRQTRPILSRTRANFPTLKKMLAQLNDEFDPTKGKLFINYPMMESAHDLDAFGDAEFKNRVVSLSTLATTGQYKKDVKKRILSQRDFSKWTRNDFDQLIRAHLEKAQVLLGEKDARLDYEKIRLLERRKAVQKNLLEVLNTSLLLPLYIYEDTRGDYTRIASARTRVRLTVLITGLAAESVNLSKIKSALDAQTNKTFNVVVCENQTFKYPKRGYVLEIDQKELFPEPSAVNRMIGFLEISPKVDELWLVGMCGKKNLLDMQVRYFNKSNAKAWSALANQPSVSKPFKLIRSESISTGASRIARVKYYPYV